MQINSIESWEALSNIDLKPDTSIALIREQGTPPISMLVKREVDAKGKLIKADKTQCYQFIAAGLIQINQFLGITWTDYQVIECSKEIYSKYFYWNQLDFKNFVSMCRRMEFSTLLSANQFSPIILMQWCERYDEIWREYSVHKTENLNSVHKKNSDREDQVYKADLSQRKNENDKIKSMQEIITNQSEYINQLKGEQ